MNQTSERRRTGRRRLALRWAIGVMELLLLTALAVAGPFLAYTFLSTRAQALDATKEVLTLVAPECADDIVSRDADALRRRAALLAQRDDIAWIGFADPGDRKLAEAGFMQSRSVARLVRVPVRLTGDTSGAQAERGRQVGWIVADPSWEQQRSQAIAAARVAGLGFLIATVLGAFLVLEWARRTLRPVRDLAEAADRVAGGDLSQPVPVRANDELGRVATEFNHMIEQLRRSRERLVSREQMSTGIIFAAQDAIIVTDPQRRITALNPKAEELTGHQLREIRGRKVETLFVDPGTVERLRETVRTGRSVPEFDTEIVCRSGRRIPVNLSVGALEGSDGETAAFVAVARDTRRIRELVSSLRDVNKKLHEAQSQILRTAKLAAVGQIAGGVAHELNNPLGGVLGFTQVARSRLAREGSLDPAELDQYLERVEHGVLRCRRIVEKLRRFAFSEKVASERLDLNATLQDALDLLATCREMSNIEVDLAPWPEPVEVMGDERQLQQALINVLTNACQAMPHGGRLEIATAVGADGSRPIGTVTFRDQGEGIAPEHLGQIFDPFFTTRPPGDGEGLGLSVAYAIVRDHGGRIDVESRRGTGTTVRFELPQAAGAAENARENSPEEAILT